ncbi:UNVERIFIED_CONTAM: protein S-acyltransferase 10 [Sesamum latifolium]|uniref:Protein S-acyltransferase 10 n=1 Tax=Sesamum latifolium TaxID=2727402 RepID=A0AAW2X766_9LAMI
MGVACGSHLRETCHRASDRCSRLFPCLSDPARRSALSLKVALIMLHLVFARILFLFDNDLIEKTKKEPWYTAIYVSLFVATLVQYFVTFGTSPSYVLDAQKVVDERDALARRALLASKKDNQLQAKMAVFDQRGWKEPSQRKRNYLDKLVMDLYPPGASIR